eukprot:264288_1
MRCSPLITISLIVHVIVCIMYLCLAVYALYTFLLKEKELLKSMSKTAKCFEISFLIATIGSLTSNIPLSLARCILEDYDELFVISWTCFSGIQAFLVLVLFFQRLVVVFEKTRLRLKQVTMNAYQIIFIVLTTYIILAMILIFGLQLQNILIAMFVVFMIAFMSLNISMVILFIYKLMQTIQSIAPDPSLISAITKLTILNTISISVTVTYTIMNAAFLSVASPNPWMNIVWDLISTLDVFTNFCCIALCYKSFKTYYTKVCSCADTRCQMCIRNTCVKSDKSLETYVCQQTKQHVPAAAQSDEPK